MFKISKPVRKLTFSKPNTHTYLNTLPVLNILLTRNLPYESEFYTQGGSRLKPLEEGGSYNLQSCIILYIMYTCQIAINLRKNTDYVYQFQNKKKLNIPHLDHA